MASCAGTALAQAVLVHVSKLHWPMLLVGWPVGWLCRIEICRLYLAYWHIADWKAPPFTLQEQHLHFFFWWVCSRGEQEPCWGDPGYGWFGHELVQGDQGSPIYRWPSLMPPVCAIESRLGGSIRPAWPGNKLLSLSSLGNGNGSAFTHILDYLDWRI